MAEYTIEKIIRNGDEYCLGGSGGGGSSDLYNIKYLAVGGGAAGNGGKHCLRAGGGGGAVLYGNQGFNSDNISVTIGCGGKKSYCQGQNGGPTLLKNNEFIIIARGGEGSIYGCDYSEATERFTSLSGNGFGNTDAYSNYRCLGGGGAGGPGSGANGGPGLCGYGGGGAFSGGTATDGGGVFYCNATNCGGGGGAGCCGDGGSGCPGIVKICYACDGSGGINTATGGNSCYVCDGYCVHEFTSNGTFCITG